jgi:hypothetical protein
MTNPGEGKRWLQLPSRSRARIEADVRMELEQWIDERAAELRAAGASEAESIRRAREEFGDLESARRFCVAEDSAG